MFYWNLIIVALLPLVIILISTLLWTFVGVLTQKVRYNVKIKNAACILVAFFLIHPNIIKSIFVSFSCEKIDDSLYLEIDMSQECWTGDHLMYVMTVAIPAFIVWGVGMPAIAILALNRAYVSDRLSEVRTLSVFGFLYNGYKFSRYYWEIIILYRKVSVVFILVFLSLVSIQVQALVALFVMMISLVFHMKS